jgi:hypothetical protein
MTGLNRTSIAGALGVVLLALPCHAQTYKEATKAQSGRSSFMHPMRHLWTCVGARVAKGGHFAAWEQP